MKKVIVIGGGASGFICAIMARRNGNDVTILERNANNMKKLLLTGNGKCNYYNIDQNLKHYHSNTINDFTHIINDKNLNDIQDFFDSIGIIPYIKDGYYYPKSNQAISMKNALEIEAKMIGVNIINDIYVNDIKKEDDVYKVVTNDGVYVADKVVVATGGKSFIKTGSDGNGYEIAKKFNHTIIKPLPGLVQIVNPKLKEASGVRTDVRISLYDNDKLLQSEEGQLQITDYGISGICAMQLSSLAKRNISIGIKQVVKINFLPWLNENIIKFLTNRSNQLMDRSISEILDGLLNYKIVNLLLKESHINRDLQFNELNDNQIKILGNNLTNYELEVLDTKDFDSAQITTGGISMKEINDDFSSKLIKNLYFIGEILDVNGDCGGYNLTFAWLSGYLAGKSL